MTEPALAKIIQLTDPDPGRTFVVGIQEAGGEELKRWRISREQLLNLNAATADILKRAFR